MCVCERERGRGREREGGESSVLSPWTPHFSKGGRARRIMGGPQRDPLEMETPLQKTLSLHKMEGGERGRVDRG